MVVELELEPIGLGLDESSALVVVVVSFWRRVWVCSFMTVASVAIGRAYRQKLTERE